MQSDDIHSGVTAWMSVWDLYRSKLTIDLILRFHAPSAASPEEVWGVSLLHENPLQWTCGGDGRRLSSQHEGIKRKDVERSWGNFSPCGSLVLPVLLGTAAESASGDTGSENKTWKTQNLSSPVYLSMRDKDSKHLSSLYLRTERLMHRSTCKWGLKKQKPKSNIQPLHQLTGQCEEHSEQCQQGCIRPRHL